MTSAPKSYRVSKPVSQRPKRKRNSEGLERLQKVLDSLNADHEAEFRASTSPSAEVEENGVDAPHETTPQAELNQRRQPPTVFSNGEITTSIIPQETLGLTILRGSRSSRDLEEPNDGHSENAQGFSRLSEQRTAEAIAACKAATSILIQIANGDFNNAYVTPYSGGGLHTYGVPCSSTSTYASPYTNSIAGPHAKPSFESSTNKPGQNSADQGYRLLETPRDDVDKFGKKQLSFILPDEARACPYGDHPVNRRKRNSSGQYLKARRSPDDGHMAGSGTDCPDAITETSEQISEKGIEEPKVFVERNEKAYPMTLGGIDSFLTQAKGRFPGPDSDDSDNDGDQPNKKSVDKQSHIDESTISPPSSPPFTAAQIGQIPKDRLSQDDTDILAIVDHIIQDLMPPKDPHHGLPLGTSHPAFKGSPEAHHLAGELHRLVKVLNPQRNIIVSKELGHAMSMFYNHLSSRAFNCFRRVIPPAYAAPPDGLVIQMKPNGLPAFSYQPLPAHLYQHVPPPPTFQQAVLPSQPPSSVLRNNFTNAIAPSPLRMKEDVTVQNRGYLPTPDSRAGSRKKQRK